MMEEESWSVTQLEWKAELAATKMMLMMAT
jgi:hypothetical protein